MESHDNSCEIENDKINAEIERVTIQILQVFALILNSLAEVSGINKILFDSTTNAK